MKHIKKILTELGYPENDVVPMVDEMIEAARVFKEGVSGGYESLAEIVYDTIGISEGPDGHAVIDYVGARAGLIWTVSNGVGTWERE